MWMEIQWKSLDKDEYGWQKNDLIDKIAQNRHYWNHIEKSTNNEIEKALDLF